MARKTKEEAQRTRQQIIDAARTVFHQHGVGCSTLEQVAKAAGLTRGAVYWHFKDKSELFRAMRTDVFDPLRDRLDMVLLSDGFDDPLQAIEASLKELFVVLDECPTVRQMMEIMILRCESADVQLEADRPGEEFLEKLETVYRKAAAKGALRPGLDPKALALDSWAFVTGLLRALIARGFAGKLKSQVDGMIAFHMTLRRI